MEKRIVDQNQPLREGAARNNQVKTSPSIDKTAVAKPPAAVPKKNK